MSDHSIFLLTILQRLFITLEIKANEPKSSMTVMAWALPSSYSALIERELSPPDCSSQVPLSTHLQIHPANGRHCQDIGGQGKKSPAYFFHQVTSPRHSGYTSSVVTSPTDWLSLVLASTNLWALESPTPPFVSLG